MTSSTETPSPATGPWLELSIEADAEAIEAVSEIFGRVASGTAVHPTALVYDPKDELAAAPDLAAPFVVTAHVPDGPEASAQVEATERALWHLQAFGLRPLGELRVRHVDDADWAGAWRDHYVPQRVGRVLIVPSWIDEPAASDEVAITLDPGMAFGTGLHPTTRACLKLLQELDPMPASVLDVGCGSGILSLAALRLGAEAAVGYDTDAAAVDASRANAVHNGMADRFDARLGTLPNSPAAPYELVLANLVAAVLIELAPRLTAHLATGGFVIASGIIAPRTDEVVGALGSAGLVVTTRRDDDDWVSLRLEHAR